MTLIYKGLTTNEKYKIDNLIGNLKNEIETLTTIENKYSKDEDIKEM